MWLHLHMVCVAATVMFLESIRIHQHQGFTKRTFHENTSVTQLLKVYTNDERVQSQLLKGKGQYHTSQHLPEFWAKSYNWTLTKTEKNSDQGEN